MPLTVRTGDPAGSRPALAAELLAAARMGGGLTLWEVLALARASFGHAFLLAGERARLLAELEHAVFRCATEISTSVGR